VAALRNRARPAGRRKKERCVDRSASVQPPVAAPHRRSRRGCGGTAGAIAPGYTMAELAQGRSMLRCSSWARTRLRDDQPHAAQPSPSVGVAVCRSSGSIFEPFCGREPGREDVDNAALIAEHGGASVWGPLPHLKDADCRRWPTLRSVTCRCRKSLRRAIFAASYVERKDTFMNKLLVSGLALVTFAAPARRLGPRRRLGDRSVHPGAHFSVPPHDGLRTSAASFRQGHRRAQHRRQGLTKSTVEASSMPPPSTPAIRSATRT